MPWATLKPGDGLWMARWVLWWHRKEEGGGHTSSLGARWVPESKVSKKMPPACGVAKKCATGLEGNSELSSPKYFGTSLLK